MTLVEAGGLDPVDAGAIQWLQAASLINRGVGPFSDFIRAYTAEQYHLRNGGYPNASKVQQSSNVIALAVIQDIIDSGGELPTLL
jgi:hypothetical protein